MINTETSLGHEFFEIAIAEGIPEIPSDAEHDNVRLVLPPFEQIHVSHPAPPACGTEAV